MTDDRWTPQQRDHLALVLLEALERREDELADRIKRHEAATSHAAQLLIDLRNIRGMAVSQFPELETLSDADHYECIRQAFLKIRAALPKKDPA